jgi:glutamate:GABA antiporter
MASESTQMQPAAQSEERVKRRRVMGIFDVTLFTVSAMLVVETLTASASIGTDTIAWWLVAIIFFLIPYGLITAELATTYPTQGGIYVWVKQALGSRWAARTTYWYWVNVALWMPSVFVLFAGVFFQLFDHHLAEWPAGKWWQVAMAIAMVWLVVWVGVMRLEVGKWVNNLGAILKVVIIFSLGVGGIVFAIRHGAANAIHGSSFVPSFGVAKNFLPVIVFLLLGFELVSSMAGEVQEPAKRIPRAIFTSGALIAFLYMFATIGILLALSLTKLHLVEGLVETFKAIFGSKGVGEVIVYALGIAALYTYFTNMTTWTMGANRSAVEAAAEGELPKVLGREHPTRHTPVGALIATGVISTVVLVVTALFINTQDSLFFGIFAASSVIFLMPYLLMFPAVAILRYKDPDRPRPFKIPGGNRLVIGYAVITCVFIAAGVLLFLWPEIPNAPEEWSYTGPLLGIVGATLVAGEVMLWRMSHPRKPRMQELAGQPSGSPSVSAQPSVSGQSS